MPKGFPLTQEDQDHRRREIFAAAVNRFLEKGFQETSMREIAEAAGMGKSSLYDYFKTKDDILLFIFEEQAIELLQQGQEIADRDLSPEERLKQIMTAHLSFMLANKRLHARLMFEAQRLNANSQKRIQSSRYAYQDLVAGIIQEGIDAGVFRPVTPLHTARLLINSLISVLYTTRPTGSPQDTLQEAVDIFLHGMEL